MNVKAIVSVLSANGKQHAQTGSVTRVIAGGLFIASHPVYAHDSTLVAAMHALQHGLFAAAVIGSLYAVHRLWRTLSQEKRSDTVGVSRKNAGCK